MKHYHQSLILSHSNDYTYTVRVFCLFQWVPYFYYWLFRAFLYCPDACSSLIDVWLKDRPCINIKPNHYYYYLPTFHVRTIRFLQCLSATSQFIVFYVSSAFIELIFLCIVEKKSVSLKMCPN